MGNKTVHWSVTFLKELKNPQNKNSPQTFLFNFFTKHKIKITDYGVYSMKKTKYGEIQLINISADKHYQFYRKISRIKGVVISKGEWKQQNEPGALY